MLFSFRTLLFITSLFVSAGTWSSCIKVTDKSALSDAAIKAELHGAKLDRRN